MADQLCGNGTGVLMEQQERNSDTAATLENLNFVVKDLVIDFRSNMPRQQLYARLYWLRRQISYLVRDYGVGLPHTKHLRSLDEKYGDLK